MVKITKKIIIFKNHIITILIMFQTSGYDRIKILRYIEQSKYAVGVERNIIISSLYLKHQQLYY